MNNAKYIIAIARKFNVTVTIIWENIKEVNPRFILTFAACIKYVAD